MTKQPLVIIPARNEEKTVGSVVDGLYRRGDYHVLVIDDASTDSTTDRARKAGAVF